MTDGFVTTLKEKGRKDPQISNILSTVLIVVFFILVSSRNSSGKISIWIASTVTVVAIFSIMSIGLNLQTGLTGLVNFGVIFFVGIGAVTTGLMNAKYGIDPWISMLIGMLFAGVIGYFLAYPTVRLRTDYFAIVTISLGEILRVALNVETTLRARTEEAGISTPGIANIKGPMRLFWDNKFGTDPPYIVLLAIISVIFLLLSLFISQMILNSPFGRVLKSIREDEEVVRSYGYNVFRYKAVILGIGSAIMALAGGLWAWLLESIFPDFLLPAASTFLVWAAYVIGGKGNNRGMIVGSIIIVYIERLSRTITPPKTTGGSLTSCADETNLFICLLDRGFRFIVIDVGGYLFGETSYTTNALNRDNIHIDVNFLRLILIGLIIIISMRFFEEGIIPELPYRPKIEYERSIKKFEQILNCPNCNEQNPVNTTKCTSCGEKLKPEET